MDKMRLTITADHLVDEDVAKIVRQLTDGIASMVEEEKARQSRVTLERLAARRQDEDE